MTDEPDSRTRAGWATTAVGVVMAVAFWVFAPQGGRLPVEHGHILFRLLAFVGVYLAVAGLLVWANHRYGPGGGADA